MTRQEIINSLRYFSPLNDRNIDWDKVDIDSLVRLDEARHIAGVPFFITSNYRTPDNPAGFATDSHREIPCSAYDIRCSHANGKWNAQKAFKIIPALISVGFNRLGAGNGHIHCDRSTVLPPSVFWME